MALDRLAKSDGYHLPIPVLVHRSTMQAIDSLVSSRLLNAYSYIACDDPHPSGAQLRLWSGDLLSPATPTYACAPALSVAYGESIAPAPTLTTQSLQERVEE